MTLDEFLNSDYIELLTPAQRAYLVEHGSFKDKKAVQKRLSKFYANVSIRKLHRKTVISVGKPRIVGVDSLQKALADRIVRSYDPLYPMSFSRWMRELGLSLLPSSEGLDAQEAQAFAITEELIEGKRNAWFQSAFNVFSTQVGSGYSLVLWGYRRYKKDDAGEFHYSTRPLNAKERQQVAELREKLAEKGIKDPRRQRKDREWKKLTVSMELDNIYNVYIVDNIDESRLMELRENLPSSLIEAQKLFREKFDRWITEKIRDTYANKASDDLRELVELGVISSSEIGIPTQREWEKFQPLIFGDSRSGATRTRAQGD